MIWIIVLAVYFVFCLWYGRKGTQEFLNIWFDTFKLTKIIVLDIVIGSVISSLLIPVFIVVYSIKPLYDLIFIRRIIKEKRKEKERVKQADKRRAEQKEKREKLQSKYEGFIPSKASRIITFSTKPFEDIRVLPFYPKTTQVLYIETKYDEKINSYIERNCETITQHFEKNARDGNKYEFIYIPNYSLINDKTKISDKIFLLMAKICLNC